MQISGILVAALVAVLPVDAASTNSDVEIPDRAPLVDAIRKHAPISDFELAAPDLQDVELFPEETAAVKKAVNQIGTSVTPPVVAKSAEKTIQVATPPAPALPEKVPTAPVDVAATISSATPPQDPAVKQSVEKIVDAVEATQNGTPQPVESVTAAEPVFEPSETAQAAPAAAKTAAKTATQESVSPSELPTDVTNNVPAQPDVPANVNKVATNVAAKNVATENVTDPEPTEAIEAIDNVPNLPGVDAAEEPFAIDDPFADATATESDVTDTVAEAAPVTAAANDFDAIRNVWSELNEQTKQAILMLVKADKLTRTIQ